ncbi:MAG: hypothetical protein FJ297_14075 [Planctomycetes bacterium]|nr:hypothetical protein [Planctomycetota bacterium]
MTTPIAFLDGEWIPADAMRIPCTDSGFLLGVTVAEQLRTFGGRLFRLDRHLARLARSLEIVGVVPPWSIDELGMIAVELASRNHRLLSEGDDLGLSMFVTPGPYRTFVPEGGGPLVGMHTYRLPFELWASKYEQGERLVVTDVRQVPASSWPPELKCRSRMHYFLADRAARAIDAGSRALLLDQQGRVTEASTANLVIASAREGLAVPPDASVLPGVSVDMLRELASELGIAFRARPISVGDVEGADEAALTSTSPCFLPVSHCNGKPIGSGRPGPVFASLMRAWSREVGVDIVAQAVRFARREPAA